MAKNGKKASLFHWDRITNPGIGAGIGGSKEVKVKSKSKSSATNLGANVSDWLENVEEDSSRSRPPVTSDLGYGGFRAPTESMIHEHNSVEAEARSLLQQWSFRQKVYEDDPLCEASSQILRNIPTRTEVKREWDHLLDVDRDECVFTPPKSDSSNFLLSGAPNGRFGLSSSGVEDEVEEFLKMDEKVVVENIMENLKKKDLVKKSQIRQLDKDWKPKQDVKEKMEKRQQQVKENREKRQKEVAERRADVARRREEAAAERLRMQNEEKQRAAQEKKETAEIENEMTRLRKEEMNRRRAEELELERAAAAAERRVASERRERIQREEDEARERAERLQKERELARKMTALATRREERRKRDHLILLQKCFNSWAGSLEHRKLQIGQAAAMADWKLLRKSFRGWWHLVRDQRLAREEAKRREETLKEQRGLQLAETFHTNHLLSFCWKAWNRFAVNQRLARERSESEEKLRNKMSAFLKAAEEGELVPRQKPVSPVTERPASSARTERTSTAKSNVPNSRTRRRTNSADARKSKLSPPREAWQVTPAHAGLPVEMLVSSRSTETEQKSAAVSATTPIGSLRPPKILNQFEQRHKAQGKILSEQAKTIKEQSRQLEELKLEQERARLQDAERTAQLQKELLERIESLQKVGIGVGAGGEMKFQVHNPNETAEKTVKTLPSPARTAVSTSNKPDAIRRMEERAAERSRLKAERLAKKRETEEAELRAKEEELAAEAVRVAEEKRQKAKDLQQKRKLEEEKKAARIAAEKHEREQINKAQEHYRLAQLKWRGFHPLLRNWLSAKEKCELAQRHHIMVVKTKVLTTWLSWQRQWNSQRDAVVKDFRESVLLRRCFSRWQMYKYRLELLEVRADQYRELRLLGDVFVAWRDYTRDAQLREGKMERMAADHHRKSIMRSCFNVWRQLPIQVKQEKERERRRDELRKRVQSILPDYSPLTN